jgi:O-succinylbenzoic acid--CoA ligase
MDWLHQAARQRPDHPALDAAGGSISYAELDGLAAAVAGSLAASGIRPGQRVAFPGIGSPAAAAALWGIPRAGAWAVAVDPRLPPAESRRRLRHAGVRAVWDPVGDGWRRRHRDHRPEGWGPPDPDARIVLFTSGTLGPARAVLLTGGNVAASAAGSAERLGTADDDRWLCVLPLHHVGGLSILWRMARAGGTVVLEERFDPDRVARLLKGGEVTAVSLVPTMLRRVLDADPGPYRGVRAVLVGGGPADPDLLRQAADAGLPALQTYGMTETASQVATVDPGALADEAGTAGKPLGGVEVRIVDAGGRPVPRGATGRIEVRGAVVSPGDLDGPERPPGHWLVTGDLGSLDRDCRLTVAGRADDVIVTGGENVPPGVVEAALRLHPGVRDVRVRGEDDAEWGRVVVADLVLDPRFAVEEVARFARSRLARFQVPKRWNVVERIERTWKQG